MTSDLAVVKLVDCVTATERQLADSGHEQLVLPARDLHVRAMRADATAIVEQFTGREVVAYLTHHDPDLTLIVLDLAASRPDGAQGFRDAPSFPQPS